MIKNKVFFPNLDGFRFFAFFLVFWQHSTEVLFSNLKRDGYASEEHSQFFLLGVWGVSFFFVLSGFLITYLLLSERLRNGKIDIKAFYIRRVLRIFPLYYLVILWGFGIYPLVRLILGLPEIDQGSFTLYALFLANFDTIYSEHLRAGFVSVLWSVSIEEQFYLVWAVLFTFIPLRFCKFLFPFVIIFSTLFRFFNSADEKIVYFHTFSVMSDLAVGGGLAYLALTRHKLVEFFESIGRAQILLIYALGFFIWLFPALSSGYWLQRLLLTLFFAFVIAEQNWSKHSFFKMENRKLFSKLGIYTYGLYSLHMIALYFLDIGFRFFKNEQTNYSSNFAYVLIGLATSLLFAYLSYEYFERRFLNLKKRFTV